jgi:ribosomal protein L37AE/L43A
MYEPIVSEALYDQVQFVLTGSRRKHSYKVCAKHELPLRGFLNCPRCGNKLTGSASTGGTSIKHFYYHCTKGSKERVKADIINNAFLISSPGLSLRQA